MPSQQGSPPSSIPVYDSQWRPEAFRADPESVSDDETPPQSVSPILFSEIIIFMKGSRPTVILSHYIGQPSTPPEPTEQEDVQVTSVNPAGDSNNCTAHTRNGELPIASNSETEPEHKVKLESDSVTESESKTDQPMVKVQHHLLDVVSVST